MTFNLEGYFKENTYISCEHKSQQKKKPTPKKNVVLLSE